jgi:hypothetical protein
MTHLLVQVATIQRASLTIAAIELTITRPATERNIVSNSTTKNRAPRESR